MKKSVKLLVVDDEAIIRDSLQDWFKDIGHQVITAENGTQALDIIRQEKPSIVISDYVMPGMDGIELMKRARELNPAIAVIIITAYGSVPTAVTAVKHGAFDFIEKPFELEKVQSLIERLVERQELMEMNPLPPGPDELFQLENIVAKSPKMQQVMAMVKTIAESNAPVMITGENGTGKRLIARAIHSQSNRRDKPFVAISCAGFTDSLLANEMFGQGGGDGTYAESRGKLEMADGGTLLIDEIGEMSPNFQAHLLKALENQGFARIGGSKIVPFDVRFLSIASGDIRQAVERGEFREDLYYRLNLINIQLPPLRERQEDVLLLAHYFLKKANEENRKTIAEFSPEATQFLLKYDWPGNIREMENAVARAVILARNPVIDVADLSTQSLSVTTSTSSGKSLDDVEKEHILDVLSQSKNNHSKAARVLGVSRMTLYSKLRAYGIALKNKRE